jgi:hypothetical protein
MTTAPGLAPVSVRVVFRTADDRDRTLRVVEIENDLEVSCRRRIGRLVHDRHLFLLRTALERVAQAEQPGRHDGAGRRAAKAVDRSLGRIGFFRPVGSGVGIFEVVHTPHRTPDLGIRSSSQEVEIT